jgi:hypothetical protein
MDILPADSRFSKTEKIIHDGKKTLGKWAQQQFLDPNNPRFSNYVVRSDRVGRPDQISEDLYGTNLYWWILVAFNAPRDTLSWPKAGETIKAPLLQDILAEL